jgi:hypothetical protein
MENKDLENSQLYDSQFLFSHSSDENQDLSIETAEYTLEDTLKDAEYTLEETLKDDNQNHIMNEVSSTISTDILDSNRDRTSIKKASSAWIHYIKENREIIKQQNPGMSFKEMANALSQRFKNLSNEERKRYDDIALADKARYINEMSQIPLAQLSSPVINNTQLELPLVCIILITYMASKTYSINLIILLYILII